MRSEELAYPVSGTVAVGIAVPEFGIPGSSKVGVAVGREACAALLMIDWASVGCGKAVSRGSR